MQSEESTRIIERFYEAVDKIIELGKIKGKSTYCEYYGINRRNFYSQRKTPTRGWFQVSWMVPLVRYYGINPRWLLTGFGPMIKKRPEKKEE
ncbi:MAG: hypothetical protein Q8R90_08015 [Bacteroidales bacterium]|nr:hypothetical protein [Bacteroidales bacterium]